jgi:hypothetical protein
MGDGFWGAPYEKDSRHFSVFIFMFGTGALRLGQFDHQPFL